MRRALDRDVYRRGGLESAGQWDAVHQCGARSRQECTCARDGECGAEHVKSLRLKQGADSSERGLEIRPSETLAAEAGSVRLFECEWNGERLRERGRSCHPSVIAEPRMPRRASYVAVEFLGAPVI